MDDSVKPARAISVREDLYQIITAEAARRGMSRSEFVRHAVAFLMLDNYSKKETRPCQSSE